MAKLFCQTRSQAAREIAYQKNKELEGGQRGDNK